jgi:hypothetical protein
MLKNCSSVFLVKFAENNLEAVTDFVKRYRLHESAAIRKPAENIEVKSRFRKTKRKG